MLPEPEGVHGEQAQLLVGPHVPGQEAAEVRVTRVAAAVHGMAELRGGGQQRLRSVWSRDLVSTNHSSPCLDLHQSQLTLP